MDVDSHMEEVTSLPMKVGSIFTSDQSYFHGSTTHEINTIFMEVNPISIPT